MKRKLFSRVLPLVLCLMLTLLTCACSTGETAVSSSQSAAVSSKEEYQPVDMTVMSLKGPTGMGISKLWYDSDAGAAANNYTFKLSSDPTEVSAAVIKGEVDVAAVPTNLASTLYSKTNGNVRVIALNTMGVLYMLEKGETIKSVTDLKGKKIYATGEGAVPQFVLNYILSANGIDPEKDVEIEYMGEHAELATAMIAGNVVIGMLPEPNVSTVLSKNSDMRIALNLTEEWEKATEKNGDQSILTMGCLVVRKSFLDEHPEAVVKFLEEYKASVDYVNSDPAAAATIIAGYEIVPAAPIAQKAIPNSNMCCITGNDMKVKLSAFLKVLYDANPNSVGGKLPDDAFYYVK